MANFCRTFKLTNSNKVGIVSAEDFDFVMQYKWFSKEGYITRSIDGKFLHRLLLNPAKEMDVDHINGNPLDNSRSNLRVCEHMHNMWNQKKTVGSRSIYKGIYWHKKANLWHACLVKNYKKYSLGYFKSEKEAAKAYDKAALEHFGEFARINFVKHVI